MSTIPLRRRRNPAGGAGWAGPQGSRKCRPFISAQQLRFRPAARYTYLTDGPSRRVVLGKRVVDLRDASPKHLIAPGSAAGTVVQTLRHVGAMRAGDAAQIAARRLSASDKKTLASSAVQTPAWEADGRIDRQRSVG
ncbi:hypothetical protein GGD56_000457 [Rhizobium mongolense]|uniref:Uncharacterized protein n=1 Tax=Rhizobium mongolense TaxID=57676 RepID=A0ABR6IFJ8_9HYPH|nr:hypothetical protein [Rhizobium mongolense]